MLERKVFLANPKHQNCVSQCGKHYCSAQNNKNGDCMSIQVCLIPWMNFNHKENGEKKLFLLNQGIDIVYPNEVNMIIVPIAKRMEIIPSLQVCIISWMNFDYKGNAGKKSFSCKSEALISCIPTWRA